MNVYHGIAIGIIVGFFIGAYLSDYYSEGFQPTANGSGSTPPLTSDTEINEANLPIACATIDKLSQGFLTRMKNRPEYKSNDTVKKASIQVIIDKHALSVQSQKTSMGCP